MPRGASPKREREYESLEKRFKKEGRYPGREEEVASRIVNKQRAQMGETKSEKSQAKKGKAPDKNLPLKNYEHLTVDQVASKMKALSSQEVRKIADYERHHKNRRTLIEQLDRKLKKV